MFPEAQPTLKRVV